MLQDDFAALAGFHIKMAGFAVLENICQVWGSGLPKRMSYH